MAELLGLILIIAGAKALWPASQLQETRLNNSFNPNKTRKYHYPLTIEQGNRQTYGSTLCSGCLKLRFETIFTKDMKHAQRIESSHYLNPSCPLCRLILDCLQWRPFPRPLYISNEESWRMNVSHNVYERELQAKYSTGFELKETAQKLHAAKRYRMVISDGIARDKTQFGRGWFSKKRNTNIIGEIQLLTLGNQYSQSFSQGRYVEPDYAYFSLLRSWLQSCLKVHCQGCESSETGYGSPIPIRVIDIFEQRVVEAPPGCQYTALSYVWGDYPQPLALTSHLQPDPAFPERSYMPLPDNLAQTIKDAMFVTGELGCRYLWVDSLCIIQDGPRQSAEIRHMDHIYSSAIVTIIDASGENSNAGLAGVSRPRKYRQPRERIYEHQVDLGIPFPDYNSIVADTSIPWNTRKWTLQEMLLSKRRIMFTDYQVYWQCSNAVWCEDTTLETNHSSTNWNKSNKPLSWTTERGPVRRKNLSAPMFGNYLQVVEIYTKRQAKDPADSISAISGVLNTFPDTFICGIPVSLLAPAFLWQLPVGTSSKILPVRDAPFPTWSWARWSLPKGCLWQWRLSGQLPFVIDSIRLPWPTMVYLKGSDIAFRRIHYDSSARDPRSQKLYSSKLRHFYEDMKAQLQEVEVILLLPCNVARRKFSIGNVVGRSYAVDKIGEYEIVNNKGECVGSINVLFQTQQDILENGRDYEFLYIGSSKGYLGSAKIQEKFYPRVKESDGEGGITTKIVYSHSQWTVAYVILGKRRGPFVERVALGSIIETAWDQTSWKKTLQNPHRLALSNWVLFA